MWFDMAGEDAQHQQAEQCNRQSDAHGQCLGGAFRLTLVLDQKQHATGQTDQDCDKRYNNKGFYQHSVRVFQDGYQIF